MNNNSLADKKTTSPSTPQQNKLEKIGSGISKSSRLAVHQSINQSISRQALHRASKEKEVERAETCKRKRAALCDNKDKVIVSTARSENKQT